MKESVVTLRPYFYSLAFLCLSVCLWLPQAFSHNLSELQNIQFEVVRSFEAMNTKTGRMINVSTSARNSVRVIGENDWAYVLKVFKDNRPLAGEFFVAKKWARRALNLYAAKHALEMNQSVGKATNQPQGDCCDNNVHDNPQEVTIFDELETSPKPKARPENFPPQREDESTATQEDYLPGCQSLDVESSSRPRDREELMRCIRSIQVQITQGARNSRGALLRGRVFRNLYSELNPQEQRFAAMVFTAHGEAVPITTGDPPEFQEMSAVMKVVDNRMRDANERSGDFNELDVVLDPMQFSMYNRNENVWRRVLDPGRSESLAKAVQSYIEFEQADFEPKPEIDRVYHYHANYVRPNWAASSKELRPRVDGDLTRPAPSGYNERSPAGRRQIARSYRRVRHVFYRDVAWSRNPQTPWRTE